MGSHNITCFVNSIVNNLSQNLCKEKYTQSRQICQQSNDTKCSCVMEIKMFTTEAGQLICISGNLLSASRPISKLYWKPLIWVNFLPWSPLGLMTYHVSFVCNNSCIPEFFETPLTNQQVWLSQASVTMLCLLHRLSQLISDTQTCTTPHNTQIS